MIPFFGEGCPPVSNPQKGELEFLPITSAFGLGVGSSSSYFVMVHRKDAPVRSHLRRIFDFRTYPGTICRSYGTGGVNRCRRGQITDDRWQRTDGRRQRTDGRGQRTDGRGQRTEDPAAYWGIGTPKSNKTLPADSSNPGPRALCTSIAAPMILLLNLLISITNLIA